MTGFERIEAPQKGVQLSNSSLTDLEKLKAVPLQIKGKRYLLRTELEGTAPAVFRILGIRPPNRVEELSSTPAA